MVLRLLIASQMVTQIVDADRALEAFKAGFDKGAAEIRVVFDDTDVMGKAVAGEAFGNTVGLAVDETVEEAIGEVVGLPTGALVGGAIRTLVGAGATDAYSK